MEFMQPCPLTHQPDHLVWRSRLELNRQSGAVERVLTGESDSDWIPF